MKFSGQTLLLVCSVLLELAPHPVQADEELQPLRYNHPGLQVDLGVGLWAWPLPCDADHDGDFDLLVSCPDKPSNGVWFFENESGDTAHNKFPIFKAARRISPSTSYLMPSYVDGQMRVLSPGWEYPEFMEKGIDVKVKLPLATNLYKLRGQQTKGPGVRHHQWRYADYDGDGLLDLIVGIEDWSDYGWDDAWNERGEWLNGPLHGFVFVHRNVGDNTQPSYEAPQQLTTSVGPIDVYGCPSPNLEDFDSDGDLDLLCGEFLDGFTYFENTGTRESPVYAPGIKLLTGDAQPLSMELQMIVPIAFDWDQDGDLDLIVGDEDGRVALVENSGVLDARHAPVFLKPRYFQQAADTLKCGALATPVGFDWDGDQDTDLLCGNTAGYIEFFENLSGAGVEYPRWAAPRRLEADGKVFRVMAGENGSIQGPAEAKWGYTTLSVADWNDDGLPDILFNSIWGRIQWLQNVGTRSEPKLAAPQNVEVQWNADPPKPTWVWWQPEAGELVTQWRTTPIACDWNQDGLCDLVMLDHQGFLAFYERSRDAAGNLQLLPPQRVFYGLNLAATDSNHQPRGEKTGPLQLNTGQAGRSGRRKLAIVDWDGDGLLDILANSTNANWLRQIDSDSSPHWLFNDLGPLVQQNIQGHTTSPTSVDFNADGLPDFIGGAENGRFYYRRNPRSTDPPSQPAKQP